MGYSLAQPRMYPARAVSSLTNTAFFCIFREMFTTPFRLDDASAFDRLRLCTHSLCLSRAYRITVTTASFVVNPASLQTQPMPSHDFLFSTIHSNSERPRLTHPHHQRTSHPQPSHVSCLPPPRPLHAGFLPPLCHLISSQDIPTSPIPRRLPYPDRYQRHRSYACTRPSTA